MLIYVVFCNSIDCKEIIFTDVFVRGYARLVDDLCGEVYSIKADHDMQELYLALKVDPKPLMDLSLQRQLHESLAVAVDLGVFRHLETSKTARELADEMALDRDVVFCLLKMLVHIGCLAEEQGRFINTPLASAYLVEDSYLYLGHEFASQVQADPFGSQLSQKLQGIWPEMASEPNWNQERLRQIGVFGLMGSVQNTVNICNLDTAKRLLDLGGGHGFFSIAFAQKYPELSVTLFDLPHIVTLAGQFIRQFAVEQQVKLMGGNFLTDDIGTGYDAVLCSNILHSSKRDIVLAKVSQALKPGGQIILRCRVSDCADNLENAVAKLRWRLHSGWELYSTEEWRAFLTGHGFRNIRVIGISGIYATLLADN